MLSLGLMLLFVGIVIGVLGRILRLHAVEKLGDTIGKVGVVLGVVGLFIR